MLLIKLYSVFLKFYLEINWKSAYNESKHLQEFYDKFVNVIILSIKWYVHWYQRNRNIIKYPSHIGKLIKEKQNLCKKSKFDRLMLQKYQTTVKEFNSEFEKKFLKILKIVF